MTRLFPKYKNTNLINIDELPDSIGMIEEFMNFYIDAIDNIPLGCMSINITKPHNDLYIIALIDLHNERFDLRVEQKNGDGFIDIKTDRNSLIKVVDAIKSNSIPLLNLVEDIDFEKYDYLIE